MSYAEFNSPQFVDFTSIETFDINDGADVLFEEYVVGEGIELGRISGDCDNETPKFQEKALLTDMSNLAINQEEKRKSFKLQKEECSEGSVKNDKENTSQAANLKSPEIVGTSAPRVGSAIDMIKATKVTTVVIEKHTTAVIGRPPVIVTKPPSAEPVVSGHKQRTVSSSAAVIPAPLLTNKPGQQPAHNGLKWIPKTTVTPSSKKPSDNQNHQTSDNQQTTANNHARPIIAGAHGPEPEKRVGFGLTRSTPGKSASMRGDKKPNIIKSLLMKTPKQISLPPKPTVSSSHTQQQVPSSDNVNSGHKPSTSSSNLKSLSNTSTTSATSTSMHTRKASETSKIPLSNGLLHTELRAAKRFEFEQNMKEKERLAEQQRLHYEQEKQRQEREIVQRLRTASNFKSQPIRHYRPVEVKPSERPLTSPKSPNLATTHQLSHQSSHLSHHNSSSALKAKHLRSGSASQDDLKS